MSQFHYDTGNYTNIDPSISDEQLRSRIADLKRYDKLTQSQSHELRDYEHHLAQRTDQRAKLSRALGVTPGALARHQENHEAIDLANINPAAVERVAGAPAPAPAARGAHPSLLVSDEHLRAHADAIREGRTYGAQELIRAAVTAATDMGTAAAWGSNPVAGPVTLRAFAGIPNTELTGVSASMPSLTLPAGIAGVAEGVAHGEYDAIARADLTAVRHGRWTKVTAAVDAFDELSSINGAHGVGVARDLNLADVSAIQTAAGAATAFDAALLDQNVRAAVLRVAEAAMVDPADVVLFGTADALAVVTGYAPASGGDRGSVSTRVYGARVYSTAAAAAGIVTAFAAGGFRTFSAALRSASTVDPTDGSHTFGSWLHSTPAGVGIVGAAASVDVVTP